MKYPITIHKFRPIFLPHKQRHCVLPELRIILLEIFRQIPTAQETYEQVEDFLFELAGNRNNYDSYRSDIVTFLNWMWAQDLDVHLIKRKEMMQFVEFCNHPPTELISINAMRPVIEDKVFRDELLLNEEWRPFKNTNPDQPYARSKATITRQLSVISSFFTYLNDNDTLVGNPAALVLRRININTMDNVKSEQVLDRSLSMLQLATMMDLLEDLCLMNPDRYERSRFLIYLLILAFPRRSEVSASNTYSPKWNDFKRIRVGDRFHWVFHIRKAKGGKSRHVVCPKKLINAMKRYRLFLGKSEYPKPDDNSPLFVRHRPASHGREAGIVDANLSSNAIYDLVKDIFKLTADRLELEMEELDEASSLRELSTHSTRHTGISLAISAGRNIETLMLDTGHSSYNSLNKYKTAKVDFRIGEVDLIDSILDSF